ncbi:MAG: protein kinase domain-containing protein [Myxococcota bacterium]
MAGQSYVLDGRFALGDLIDKKPIGDFYKATDNQTNGNVIVFITQPDVVRGQNHAEEIEKELETLKNLTGIKMPALIYYNLLPDGRMFTVNQPIESSNLSERITQGVIPPEEAIGYFKGMIDTLSKAAESGIFHRELEPSNILFGKDGTVYLSNFGFAQPVSDGIYGNPWFMSPEQATGKEPGLASSIYSLSAILYYMVVGIPPFSENDQNALIQAHLQKMPAPPTEIRPELPQTFNEFIKKGMAKNSNARYPNLQVLLNEAITALFPKQVSQSQSQQPAPESPPVNTAEQPSSSGQSAQSPEPVSTSKIARKTSSPKEKAVKPAQNKDNTSQSTSKSRRRPRRRKKGGFRETLWFKKGEVERSAGPVKADELMEVKKGTGELSDEDKELAERYKDGSEKLTSEDRRQFSVRTGQTGVFQAVKVEDMKAVEQKREIAESKAAAKRSRNKKIFAILGILFIAVLVVVGLFIANKLLYKPVIKSGGIDKLEAELRKVKPPPPPQFVAKEVEDPKDPTAHIKKTEKLIQELKLVPTGNKGQSDTACEYLLGLKAIAEENSQVKKYYERLKMEFVKATLSLEFAHKNHDNLKLLKRTAEALKKLAPNNAHVNKFERIVNFYLTPKGQRSKIKIKSILALLPHYPPAKPWLLGVIELARDKVKKVSDAWNLYGKKFKEGNKALFEPYNDSALTYFLLTEKLLGSQKRLDRKQRRIKKKLVKAQNSLYKALHNQLQAYLKAENWRLVERTIQAIGNIAKKDKKAIDIHNKHYKKFPPSKLKEVDKKFGVPK